MTRLASSLRVVVGRARQWWFHRTAVWFLGSAVHMSTWATDPSGDRGVTRILITRDWQADTRHQRACVSDEGERR